MDDRRTISLALGAGECRQLLVEAGSSVLVVSGKVLLRSPAAWLAETVQLPERLLESEQVALVENTGWIDLLAREAGQLVLIPPDAVSLWRKVGLCLEAMFAERNGPMDEASVDAPDGAG